MTTTSYSLPLTTNITPDIGVGAVTFTRASAVWLRNDAGVYTQFGSGVAAINSDGLLCEPLRVNRCTNYNAAPDAAKTNISVSAGTVVRALRVKQLADAGLANICSSGYVWRLNNTTGSSITITLGGTVSGTNAAAVSLFAWVTGAACTIQITGAKGAQLIGTNDGFERFVSESIGSVAGTEQMQIVVPAGACIEWVLNQLEQGANTTVASVTSPIVIAGAVATRNATVVSIPGSILPTNNYAVVFDLLSHTTHGDSGNPCAIHALIDGSNRMLFTIANGVNLNRIVAASAQNAYAKHAQQLERVTYGLLADSVLGLYAFSNGSQGYGAGTSAAFQPTAVYLGARSDGSQAFCGQIRNFRVLTSVSSLAEIQALTEASELLSTDLGAVGIPLYDRAKPGRIWALRHNGTAYNVLSYSDNWGGSWTDFVTLSTTTTSNAVQMDRAGNFYYGTSVGLYKVTRALVQTKVLDWSPTTEGSWSFTNWAWGEDSAGNLYVAGYHLSAVGYQRLWKSTDGGATWANNDSLISGYPSERHVHSLRCIPASDKIYISFGDGAARGLVVSADGLATAPTLITQSPAGPTCISYSDEGVYTFSDVAGDVNYVDLVNADDSGIAHSITLPIPGNLAPIYFGALAGNNEIWAVTRNDNDTANQFSGVFKFTKSAGRGNQWRRQQLLATLDRTQGSIEYFGLAHDGTGIIPESADYVFVGYRNESDAVSSHGMLRIRRTEIAAGSARPGTLIMTPTGIGVIL